MPDCMTSAVSHALISHAARGLTAWSSWARRCLRDSKIRQSGPHPVLLGQVAASGSAVRPGDPGSGSAHDDRS